MKTTTKNTTMNLIEEFLIPKFGTKVDLSLQEKLLHLFDVDNRLFHKHSYSTKEEYEYNDCDLETSSALLTYIKERENNTKKVLKETRNTLALYLQELYSQIQMLRQFRFSLIGITFVAVTFFNNYFSIQENKFSVTFFIIEALIIIFQFSLLSYFILDKVAIFLNHYQFKKIIKLTEELTWSSVNTTNSGMSYNELN